jgi:hypothetical protein
LIQIVGKGQQLPLLLLLLSFFLSFAVTRLYFTIEKKKKHKQSTEELAIFFSYVLFLFSLFRLPKKVESHKENEVCVCVCVCNRKEKGMRSALLSLSLTLFLPPVLPHCLDKKEILMTFSGGASPIDVVD